MDGDHWQVPSDLVGFELVVFERRGAQLVVTVRGMTSARDLEAGVFESGNRATLTIMGVPGVGEVRPFEVVATLSVEDGHALVVRGLAQSEAVTMSDLPDGLPVVCGADPLQAGLDVEFLHRRGDRYVLMNASVRGQAHLRHPASLVA